MIRQFAGRAMIVVVALVMTVLTCGLYYALFIQAANGGKVNLLACLFAATCVHGASKAIGTGLAEGWLILRKPIRVNVEC